MNLSPEQQHQASRITNALVAVFTEEVVECDPRDYATELVAHMIYDALRPNTLAQLIKLAASTPSPDDETLKKHVDSLILPIVRATWLAKHLIGTGLVSADNIRDLYCKVLDSRLAAINADFSSMAKALSYDPRIGEVANLHVQHHLREEMIHSAVLRNLLDRIFLDPDSPAGGPSILHLWKPAQAALTAAKLTHPDKADLIAQVEELL